jgi:hypothetical protein
MPNWSTDEATGKRCVCYCARSRNTRVVHLHSGDPLRRGRIGPQAFNSAQMQGCTCNVLHAGTHNILGSMGGSWTATMTTAASLCSCSWGAVQPAVIVVSHLGRSQTVACWLGFSPHQREAMSYGGGGAESVHMGRLMRTVGLVCSVLQTPVESQELLERKRPW